MKLAGALTLKNFLIFSALSGAFVATPFILGVKNQKDLFSLNKVSGLKTRVGIFLKGFQNKEIQVASINSNFQSINERYDISKVSIESSSSSPKKKTPDLIAEFHLDYLSDPSWWSICIPEESLLKDKKLFTSSQSETSRNNQKLCETKWLGNWSNHKNLEIIQELLHKTSQFLEVENAYNTLLSNNKNVYFWDLKKNGELSKKLESIKKDCQLSNTDPKVLVKELMEVNPANCFLSPINMRVNFELNKNQNRVVSEPTTQLSNDNKNINKENISKSLVTGRIDYSLFDYSSGKRKNIQIESQNKKAFPIFKFETQNKYSLSGGDRGSCKLDLEELHKFVKSKKLKFEQFIMSDQCYKSN